MLAPLAGIGNWFVRLQAKRYGAGLAFSEMVSSHAIHYRNEKTCTELLRIHPDERAYGPVAIQLFGQDPEIMRSAAATVAAAGADIIDLNMGCPVPKVCKTGAGAAMLGDPDTAVAVAARRAGGQRPAGHREAPQRPQARGHGRLRARAPARRRGRRRRDRLPPALRAGPAQGRAGPRARRRARARTLPAPVILSGGMRDPAWIADAFEPTGATAVMLARGALGQPVALRPPPGPRARADPTRTEILDELDWVVDRAAEHLGEDRAARYLRKFYPWYVERLGEDKAVNEALQRTASLADARAVLSALREPAAVAA